MTNKLKELSPEETVEKFGLVGLMCLQEYTDPRQPGYVSPIDPETGLTKFERGSIHLQRLWSKKQLTVEENE